MQDAGPKAIEACGFPCDMSLLRHNLALDNVETYLCCRFTVRQAFGKLLDDLPVTMTAQMRPASNELVDAA